MQNITAIYVVMCRNFEQYCLLLCVDLNRLVELFPQLADLKVIIHDLGHSNASVSHALARVSLAKKEVERL